MSNELQEPYPPPEGVSYPEGSPEFEERLIYIIKRTERYLEQFKDFPLFNFDKSTKETETAKKTVDAASVNYAKGLFTIEEITPIVKRLKDAYKIAEPEVKKNAPLSPEAARDAELARRRDYWKQKHRAAHKGGDPNAKESVYPPGIPFVLIENPRLREEYLKAWQERISINSRPVPGVVCVTIESSEAWDANGNPIPVREAEDIINRELGERYFLGRIVEQSPEAKASFLTVPASDIQPERKIDTPPNPAPENAAVEPPIDAGGKSLDELKREVESKKLEKRKPKLK